MRGTIIRVDRRKQTCCVALDTDSIIRQVWLPYELVEPVDPPRVGPGPQRNMKKAAFLPKLEESRFFVYLSRLLSPGRTDQ